MVSVLGCWAKGKVAKAVDGLTVRWLRLWLMRRRGEQRAALPHNATARLSMLQDGRALQIRAKLTVPRVTPALETKTVAGPKSRGLTSHFSR